MENEKRKPKSNTRQDELLRWLMGSREGREFVWNMLSDCGLYRNSFTGNSQTFFNEGARNVGLKLLADVNRVCPNEYLTMIKERQE